MNKRDIAILACRIMAVWVFVQMVIVTGVQLIFRGSFLHYLDMGLGESLLPALLGLGLVSFVVCMHVAAGIFLWAKADMLASVMTADMSHTAPEHKSPMTYEMWMRLAVAAIGVFLLPQALAKLAAAAVVLLQPFFSIWDSYGQTHIAMNLLESIVLLLISGVLILRPTGIVRLVLRMRTIGTKQP